MGEKLPPTGLIFMLLKNLIASSPCGFEGHKTDIQELIFLFNENARFEAKYLVVFRLLSLNSHNFLVLFVCFKVFKYNFSSRILKNYITLYTYREKNSYFFPFCQKVV